jgi:hypothetical protein
MHHLLEVIWLTILTLVSLPCLAGVDSIQRDVWSDGNAVWVKDDLHFSEEMAEMHGYLWQIFADAKENGSVSTNLQQHVADLLGKESLAVHSCNASFTNGYVNLHIVSVVTFESNEKPALIHIVSSLGGETVSRSELLQHPEKIGQKEYLGGRLVNEIFIYKLGEKFMLHFPNLGSADNDLSNFDDFRAQFDFASLNQAEGLKNNQKYTCTIESCGSLNLLDWTSGKLKECPTLSELRIMNLNTPISENDLISLCSTMHIAKGGYYELSSAPSPKK